MIKIEDKVWAVKGVNRNGGLAYMCQVTLTKTGEPDSATRKMQTTGRNWASVGEQWSYQMKDGQYEKDENGAYIRIKVSDAKEGQEAYYDNVPTTGFYIGSSVSRWSTENKVFNVKDPRGFMVQVPTGNIETLLHTCTVVRGVIQEECVWAREGNSHVLLPVHSEEYKEARKAIKKVEEALKISDLNVGDRVTLLRHGNLSQELEYLGQVKLTWKREASENTYKTNNQSGYYYYGSRYYSQLVSEKPLEDELVADDKWVALFGYQSTRYLGDNQREAYFHLDHEISVKVMSRTPGEPSEKITLELLNNGYAYGSPCPERVTKKFKYKDDNNMSNPTRIKTKDVIESFVIRK